MKLNVLYIKLLVCYLVCFYFPIKAQEINYIPFKTANQMLPSTIDLSSNTYVGSIDGKAGSSGGGGATYTVPIQVPAGTGGMQPNLGLVYSSSNQGKRLLGKGWNLIGLSAITRTPKTRFHDKTIDPVSLNENDRFSIDGTRLYPQAVNSADGTTYKTEKENQSLITSHGNTNNAPDYFTVETKDGITHVYGKEPESKMSNYHGDVLVWYRCASYDKFGNYVRYVYEEVDYEYRLHSIVYNGDQYNPRSYIRFSYKDRYDTNTRFHHHRIDKQKSLLSRIDVYYGDNIYQSPNWEAIKAYTYSFKYSKDETDSYLSEIHKISGDGSLTYNPTIFYYGKFNLAPLVTESTVQLSNSTTGHQDYLVGDFNGDGLSDIAKLEVKEGTWDVPITSLNAGRITYKGFTVTLNNGDGNSYTSLPRVGFLGNSSPPFQGTQISDDKRIVFRTGDFDGDGRQEIMAIEFEAHNKPNKMYSYSIFDIQGNTITEKAYNFQDGNLDYVRLNENHNLNYDTRHAYIFNNAVVTGDFDGDQSTDIILNYHYENDTDNRSWFHNPRLNYIKELKSNSEFEVPEYLLSKQHSRPPSLMAYDVDKDGDSELLAVYDSVYHPLIYNSIELTMTGEQLVITSPDQPQAFVVAHDFDFNLKNQHASITPGTILFHSGYPSYYLTVNNDPDYSNYSMNIFEGFVDALLNVFSAPVRSFSSSMGSYTPPVNSNEGMTYALTQMFNAEPYIGIQNLRCSDFNGDGILDIKFESLRSTDFKHYIVHGVETNIDFNAPYKANIWSQHITELDFGITNNNKNKHRILPFDYNADGLTDFIEFDTEDNGYSGDSRMTIHFNKGDGFFGQQAYINTAWNRGYVNTGAAFIPWNIYPGHFNRDSKLDLLFDLPINYSPAQYSYSDNEHLMFIMKKSVLSDDIHRLVSVRNGQGKQTHFEYKMMSDPEVYTKGSGMQYPFSDFQANTPMLYKMYSDNGVGGYITNQYKYKAATVHRGGRGYLGFDETEVLTLELNSKQVSKNKLLAGALVKMPYLTEAYNTSGSSDILMARSETKYKIPTYNLGLYAFSNNIHKCYTYNVLSTTTANYLEGGVSHSIYDFDDYDNLESQTNKTYTKSNFSSGTFLLNSADLVETTSLTNTYGQYNTWVPASLTQSTQTVNYQPGAASANTSVSTKYSYYSNGLSKYVHHYYGTPKTYYDHFTYYTNGLMKTSKTAGGGMTKNSTTYEYDDFQRLKKTINVLGEETVYTYYDMAAAGGQVKSTILASGLTTLNYYNSFGHPYKTVDERGITSITASKWVSDPSIVTSLRALYQVKTSQDGAPDITQVLDRLGRQVRSVSQSFGGQDILVDTRYNELGVKKNETEPHYQGQVLPVHYTSFTYDNFNRLIQRIRFASSGGSDPYSYLKATTTLDLPIPNSNATYRATSVTAPDGRIKTTYTDFTGKPLEIIENGTSVKYKYYKSGRLKSTNVFTPNLSSGGDYDQTMVEYVYDIQGNQIQKIDNSIGSEAYAYNDYGELISETNSNGEVSTYTYDVLGRPVTETRPEGVTTHTYWSLSDITPIGSMKPGLGMLKSQELTVSGSPKHTINYTYNSYSDIEQVSESYNGESPVTKSFIYNVFGDVKRKEYHTGFALTYEYEQGSGELERILSPSISSGINAELLKIESKDAYGHVLQYTRGSSNALTTYNIYNERGFLVNNKVGTIQDINYNFNHQSGNLKTKQDLIADKLEDYTYDNFDRLKSTQVSTEFTQFYSGGAYMNFASNEPLIDVDFHESENLNINSKSQVAQSITYNSAAVNQIESVTTASGVPADLQLGLILDHQSTSFHKPKQLWVDRSGVTHDVNFEFGADLHRKRSLIKKNGSLIQKRLYYDEYEELHTYNSSGSIEDTYKMHHIGIGNGLELVYTTKNGITDGWNNVFFTLTDFQGSVLKVANRQGQLIDQLSYNYDAWGRRRDLTSWTYDGSSTEAEPTGGVDANGNDWGVEDWSNPGETLAPPIPPVQSSIGTVWFNRGYTGHEHYDDFQMIHMNARLYNPLLGNFYSPDRLIADPTNSQNYNRYSYALGNPVKYTDPSGYSSEDLGFGAFGGRAFNLFSAAFFGGDIAGMSFGTDDIFNEVSSENLGNQFNNVPTEPDGPLTIKSSFIPTVVLVDGGRPYFEGDYSYFEYAFNGIESPYQTLDEYNEAMGTSFTDHSEAMMWHNQTFYVDPAQAELNSKITSGTHDAAVIIGETASYFVGGEGIILKAAGFAFKLVKGARIAKAAHIGLKAKYASISKGFKFSKKVASTHCFIAGTQVHTKQGLKSIENLVVGEKVWSYNEQTGQVELSTVLNTQQSSSTHSIRLFLNNDTLTTTFNHPFYSGGQWVKAGLLQNGDTLKDFNQNNLIIQSVEFLDDSVEVYNFEVENHHNYYVGKQGVLVHNKPVKAKVIKAAKGLTKIPTNRLNHIFGKSEHALDGLVKQFGSQNKAYNAVQNAATQALKSGKLTPNAKGILPSGNAGNLINVGGTNVRLIGGRVVDGKVVLSSFSRKGL